MTKNLNFHYLLLANVLITLLRIAYLYFSDFNLNPDEAQYWVWSKNLDWGYYSKPPMIAWLISSSTYFCGNSEFCIRLLSPILHLITSLVIYQITKEVVDKQKNKPSNKKDNQIACLASITYITLPGVTLSSSLMSTDAALLLFWALSLLVFLKAIKPDNLADNLTDNLTYWVMAGFTAGFGMLSKYTMIVFLLSAMVYLWFANRKLLFNYKPWLAVLVGSIVLLPNIVWNLDNGMVSVLHTGDNLSGNGQLFSPIKLLEFIGAQFGVFGPVLFSVLLYIIFFKKDYWQNQKISLIFFILPIFIIVLIVSFITRAHGNWAAPMYIAASILVADFLIRSGKVRLLYASVILHTFIMLLFFNFYNLHLDKIINPFKNVQGWDKLAWEVKMVQAKSPDTAVFSDERKTVASLKYYLRDKLNTPADVYKWNKDGMIHDHFDMTSDIKTASSKNFIFVTRARTVDHVTRYFDSYKRISDKKFDIYLMKGFKGY